ncbi:SRPBCC family protein [Parvibaculum sp.]|uniref:aromatic ring-hydroxylating oxygenase subunit alpha n=1 Tax=Parvibaculum sp. TaxID=2024848 RepID=UPI00320EBBD1
MDAIHEQGAALGKSEIRSCFDSDTGTLDRRVFADEDIYNLELRNIFARAWNFMCHESQIPNVGDYVINYIGEDQVIIVRDKQGDVQVLLNTCRHRGNALCRAEQGNAKSFVCSYHGWNYDLNGDLIGVPGLTAYYRKDIDKSQWGLAKAAQVDHFHGLYFATLDPDAPSLHDYLGDVGRVGLGLLLAQGDVEVVEGVQRNIIDCNWKVAVDNLFDWYHVQYSHASAGIAGFMDIAAILHPQNQMVMLGEYGHAISGPAIPQDKQDFLDGLSDEERRALAANIAKESKGPPPPIRMKAAKELLGPVGVRSMGHPNIFPNLWVSTNGTQLCLRLPRGPFETEIRWYTVLPKAMPEDVKRQAIAFNTHLFGPAGMLEQDDGENWSQSTRASRGVKSRSYRHHMAMGLGHDEVMVDPSGQSRIETTISEHAQRWLYRNWMDWMAADSWADLKEDHSRVPEGRV